MLFRSAIGNALEVKEIIEVLNGKEVNDLIEITICLAKEAIDLVGVGWKPAPLKEILSDGKALKKFEEMISAQGGNLKEFNKINKAKHIEIIKSEMSGYIQNIDALLIGEIVHKLGAGRQLVSDKIDHSVGIILYKKYGDKVSNDEPLLEIHTNSKNDLENVKNKLISSIRIAHNIPPKLKLVQEIIK